MAGITTERKTCAWCDNDVWRLGDYWVDRNRSQVCESAPSREHEPAPTGN